jgi:hypothetical protein
VTSAASQKIILLSTGRTGLARPPALPEDAFSAPHPHPEMLPEVPFSAPQGKGEFKFVPSHIIVISGTNVTLISGVILYVSPNHTRDFTGASGLK